MTSRYYHDDNKLSDQIDSMITARDMLATAIDQLETTISGLSGLIDNEEKEKSERIRLARKGTLVI